MNTSAKKVILLAIRNILKNKGKQKDKFIKEKEAFMKFCIQKYNMKNFTRLKNS